MKDRFEVWADESTQIPYVLIVMPKDDGFVVCDPMEKNSECFEAADYETVKMWLLDEDELVGRKEALG